MLFEGKKILVTGGTGSLGKTLIYRLLTSEMGKPEKVTAFSRDEAKQHEMRLEWKHLAQATDEVVYKEAHDLLHFQVGDVRNYATLCRAIRGHDIVFNAAALKQVPTCEYFPMEAVETNVIGPHNLVRAVLESNHPPELVVGVSTDKACKPVNVMGMTKSLQERILIQANLESKKTRWMCVRYGNVIASRGSAIPLFQEQIKRGGPVTITLKEMTRFLLSLDRAVDTIFATVRWGKAGETFIPKCPAARVVDIAKLMIGDKKIPIVYTGIRPGEKIHEVLVSEEECYRTVARENYYAIQPILPELRSEEKGKRSLTKEYSSSDHTINSDTLSDILKTAGYI
ncbi:MAG: polysaccharide biosynthesis protein [Deltaproteobacteria bacterium RIFCSPLOWO2_01_44_7]|nr:MAG: polysaccharide biosynthesis protein [Deltaproteobacteria bacterium RIFCSPHIGHO2_01_FULL_43_49]OGQ16145.1 MAG: polysaccharide biosynthesis protein [Deltaproteobacteria bacterium RIFCSPHIGHO2_02_FULL_44_53]OGQ29106.1 MAG: polysaccharide biosynthesis protein [Deltaproteobacteria bacterium RIFCSPHIGHO2_12_FULL_44_21]OGQ32662.1 MAG: polysaccharide biosynthesis protein [Deltaproteobacteria bacterium RIFCSPLOWO2_01_FULL_45_74]OGQ41091.1 MAG: polysaccharide biosynthesis protein [Deltaproteobact